MSQPIDIILARLEKTKKSTNGKWIALCPAHDDKKRSLSISEDNQGKVALHCFTGCRVESIVDSISLKMKDLFPNNGKNLINQSNKKPQKLTLATLAKDKKLPESFLKELGVVQKNNHIQITYYLEDGSQAPRQRKRTALKAKNGTCWENKKENIIPYGLWKLPEARKKGYLNIPEGESDCWTFWFHCFPALGIPGASMANTLKMEHLEGISKIYLINEGGQGGSTFINGINKVLKEIGWKGKAFVITLSEDTKDPNALHKLNPNKFKKDFQTKLQQALPLSEYLKSQKDNSSNLDSPIIKQDIPLNIQKIHPTFVAYIYNFEGKTEAPLEYILSTFLVALGTSVGKKVRMRAGLKWRVPNLFLLIIGSSTFMCKTTSLNYGLNPLIEINKDLKKQYLSEEKEYQQKIATLKKNEEAPEKPKDLSFIYPNDITPEQLLVKMKDKSDGLFKLSEAGAFLAKMNKTYSGDLKEMLTSLYDGEPYCKETKTSGSFYIEEPFPSLVGASTFQWLQIHLKDEDLLSGFLARFCYVVRRTYPKINVPIEEFIELNEEWKELFQNIIELDLILKMSEEAKESYSKWYSKMKYEYLKEEVFLHSPLGRLLREVSHKIAMINHILDLVQPNLKSQHIKHKNIIEKRSYDLAYPWIEFFVANVKSCYLELTQGENLQEHKVMEVIRKKGKEENGMKIITQSRLLTYTNFKKLEELEKATEMLIAKNQLKKLTKPGSGGNHTLYSIKENKV